MAKKTLVFGASLNSSRYSHMAIRRLRGQNIEVVALGLTEGRVEDVDISKEKIDYSDLDTITLYLNPKNQESYYDYILDLNPKRVIFNPGTENPELIDLLQKNGIEAEIACTLVLLSMNQY
jgi:hypothetical protein